MAGRVWVPATFPPAFYEAIGYHCLAGLAIRLDILERFAAEARQLARHGPFKPSPALDSILNAPKTELGKILRAMGYREGKPDEQGTLFLPRRQAPSHRPRRQTSTEDSPFAVLRQTKPG